MAGGGSRRKKREMGKGANISVRIILLNSANYNKLTHQGH